MTVYIEKPAINLREKLAELNKPTGIAGEAMLRAETPQEQFNLIGAGRRNWVINGDMQVSQRGDYTSAVAFNNNEYGLDRWKCLRAGVTATIQQKTTDQPNGYVGKSLRVEATSSASGYVGAAQLIEDYDRLKLREITVSAYVRSSGVDGHVYLYDGGSYLGKGTMVTHGLGWQKVQITGVVKSTATSLGIYFVTTTSADGSQSHTTGDWIEFTQVQLELGKVATPFEHRSYGEELALCQRYYFRLQADGALSLFYTMGQGYTSNGVFGAYSFPVEMRTRPTALEQTGTASDYLIDNGSGISVSCTSVPTFGSATNKYAASIVYTSTGNSAAGAARGMYINTNGYLGWSAEL